MNRYVIVFAHQIPGVIAQRVILVERVKNDWQRGRLNLPGGRIEPGESPQQAASRELREEVGIACPAVDIKVLGVMSGPDWVVHVCYAPYRPWYNGGPQKPQQMEDQVVHELDYRQAITDPLLIPNLRIILPLCIAQVEGWSMRATDDQAISSSWEINFEPVNVPTETQAQVS